MIPEWKEHNMPGHKARTSIRICDLCAGYDHIKGGYRVDGSRQILKTEAEAKAKVLVALRDKCLWAKDALSRMIEELLQTEDL